MCCSTASTLDCKTVDFFLKISKEIGNAWRKSLMRANRASLTRPTGVWGERVFFSVSPQSRSLFSASFHTFCLTARAYLNTQKYGLFCSLTTQWISLSSFFLTVIMNSLMNELTSSGKISSTALASPFSVKNSFCRAIFCSVFSLVF